MRALLPFIIKSSKTRTLSLLAGAAICAGFSITLAAEVSAQRADRSGQDVLTITNDPLPLSLREKIYNKPVRNPEITPNEIAPQNFFSPTQTLVSGEIDDLGNDLFALQGEIAKISGVLSSLQRVSQNLATDYFASTATINAQLQTGTTPGNPRLVDKVSQAEDSLRAIAANVTDLNELAVSAARIATEISFLLEETRAAYNIAGAVEEDHVRLTELEDNINSTIILVERLLNTLNDDITRSTAYLASERQNIRVLALGVSTGDLYGKSLALRPFSSAAEFDGSARSSVQPVRASSSNFDSSPAPSGPRVLAKIKFDQPNVEYEQPVYIAVSQALETYPDAKFDLVAVYPSEGNAAQVAIENTRARRNAEKVLRTLTQQGLSLDRIDLSTQQSAQVSSNEVHLYLR